MNDEHTVAKPTPLPWKWDGDSLWHIGQSYEDESDMHLYTGINADVHLYKSPVLASNKKLIVDSVNQAPTLQAEVERLRVVEKAAKEVLNSLTVLMNDSTGVMGCGWAGPQEQMSWDKLMCNNFLGINTLRAALEHTGVEK